MLESKTLEDLINTDIKYFYANIYFGTTILTFETTKASLLEQINKLSDTLKNNIEIKKGSVCFFVTFKN